MIEVKRFRNFSHEKINIFLRNILSAATVGYKCAYTKILARNFHERNLVPKKKLKGARCEVRRESCREEKNNKPKFEQAVTSSD